MQEGHILILLDYGNPTKTLREEEEAFVFYSESGRFIEAASVRKLKPYRGWEPRGHSEY